MEERRGEKVKGKVAYRYGEGDSGRRQAQAFESLRSPAPSRCSTKEARSADDRDLLCIDN